VARLRLDLTTTLRGWTFARNGHWRGKTCHDRAFWDRHWHLGAWVLWAPSHEEGGRDR